MWLPEIAIEICIPTMPFRIHPDPERKCKPLLCVIHEKQWWLAHPEGVRPGQLDWPVWVELYQGVQASGEPFLMPVYRYDDERMPSTQAFLADAVARARREWVKIDGHIEDPERSIEAVAVPHLATPVWNPHWLLPDLIDIAFGGRYIGTWRDVCIHLLGTREHVLPEVREDYFFWMRKQFDPDDLQLDGERSPELI